MARVITLLGNLICAFKFLTIIPIDTEDNITPSSMERTMVWFPVVGLMMGLLLVGVYVSASKVFPPEVADILVLTFLVILSGAMHVDGLADTLDGLLGMRTRERMLEIMRDSRVGSFGVVGIVCLLGIKYTALHALYTEKIKLCALLLMPAIGRWSQIFGAALCNYARSDEGKGKAFIDNVDVKHLAVASVIPILATACVLKISGLLAIEIVVIVILCLIVWIRRRIGGMTGDTLGALSEIGEMLFLLAYLLVSSLERTLGRLSV